MRYHRIISKYPTAENVKEWSILSRYELWWYIPLLIISIFLYIKWNSPQKRVFEIEAETVNPLNLLPSHAFFYLDLPMTSNDSTEGSLRGVLPSYIPLSSLPRQDIQHYIDSIAATYSLPSNQFSEYFHFSNQKNTLVFKKTTSPQSDWCGERIPYFRSKGIILKSSGLDAFFYSNYFGHPNKQDYRIAGHKEYSSINSSLNRAKWWSLFDISQSAIIIRMKSRSFMNLHMTMDFFGPVDIYNLSDIEFQTKGSKTEFVIENQGTIDKEIKLYVKFKDLENAQMVRVFFITVLLGSLIILLLAFLIIYIYRRFISKEELTGLSE